MNWHYSNQGKSVGPVSDQELAQLYRSGTINSDTLVWSEGMTDWQPFRQVKLDMTAAPDSAPPVLPQPELKPGEVICAECGNPFPIEETIAHGKIHVCAACKPAFLQKLAEGAKVQTGHLNYAGFGIRFGAKFLDGLIIGIPMLVIYLAVMIPLIRQNAHDIRTPGPFPMGAAPVLLEAGFFLVQISYQTFFLGKFGATPGKMLCKLQVVTAEGERFGYGRALGRTFAEMLSGMICYIGYLMVLFDSQKRALHDHICNTRVIEKST